MPKRLLVCAQAETQHCIAAALKDIYQLTHVETLACAKHLLAQSEHNEQTTFDLVIGDVRFDESRMFELLQYIRAFDHLDALPFVAVQIQQESVASEAQDKATRACVTMLGACEFVQLAAYSESLNLEKLREAVRHCLGVPVSAKRLDQGGSEHKPLE